MQFIKRKNKIFVVARISKFLLHDDFKLIRITCQAACHSKTEHGINNGKNRAKLLLSSLPVSPPTRVLRARGHITVPFGAEAPGHVAWRPEQSHLLPEACSPNGTDNRQRQRQTKRPRPKPSDILKICYVLYDDKLHYYMNKVSKL